MTSTLAKESKRSNMFLSEAAQLWDIMYGPIAVDETDFIFDICKAKMDTNSGTALDIGCGTGRYVIPLAKNGWHVTGIDESSSMLGVLKNKMLRHNVSAHLFNTNFSDFTSSIHYDLIFAFFSIVYTLKDRDVLIFLQQVHELLHPDGIFMFNFFNAYEFWNADGWKSKMAKVFKGGHLTVNYTSTPQDTLRGIATTEDFRQFSHQNQGMAFDATLRPIRFHSPHGMKLFMEKAGFNDIQFYEGFSGRRLGSKNPRAAIITAVATRQ